MSIESGQTTISPQLLRRHHPTVITATRRAPEMGRRRRRIRRRTARRPRRARTSRSPTTTASSSSAGRPSTSAPPTSPPWSTSRSASTSSSETPAIRASATAALAFPALALPLRDRAARASFHRRTAQANGHLSCWAARARGPRAVCGGRSNPSVHGGGRPWHLTVGAGAAERCATKPRPLCRAPACAPCACLCAVRLPVRLAEAWIPTPRVTCEPARQRRAGPATSTSAQARLASTAVRWSEPARR